MAVEAEAVTVDTSVTLLASAGRRVEGNPARGEIHNKTGGVLYIGGSTVDDTDGYEVADDGKFSYELDSDEALYGVLAASSGTVKVLRTKA